MLKVRRLAFITLATAVLAVACGPGQPPPDVDDIVHDVETSVAATVYAIQTGTAAAQPPVTATFTPTFTLTATFTPAVPSATPFVITPPTSSGGGGGGGGGGSTTATYSCDPDIGKRPRDNSEYAPGDDFDIKWTILNTGTATWPDGTDLTYFSGPMMTGAAGLELPALKPGDSYSVVFDAQAPMQSGFHVMTWKVQGGFCYPYVAIRVK